MPEKVDTVTQVMMEQLERIASQPVTSEELTRAKGQLRGGTVLGMEDTASRMQRLGKAELVRGEFVDISDSLAEIDAVTADDITRVARRLAESPGPPPSSARE